MNKPVDCPFFHGDYFRGRAVELCRLIERNGQSAQWNRSLCQSCPVPGIVRETNCKHLALEAEIQRRFGLFPRVVPFAVCTESLQPLPDAKRCDHCG